MVANYPRCGPLVNVATWSGARRLHVGHSGLLRFERGRRATGEGDGEGGAGPDRAGDRDLPPQRLAQLAGDPEPEPEPRVLPLTAGPLEAPENALLILGRDADSVVAHDELDHVGGAAPFDLDPAAGAVLDGVGDEVGGDLVEAR